MAGGIADGKEDGFVFLFRADEGFLSPGIPIHRVVGVLEQIGTFLVDQPVGVLERIHGSQIGGKRGQLSTPSGGLWGKFREIRAGLETA
jgi:hypothetical protein